MTNTEDPDHQFLQVNWSGSTIGKGRVYLGSAVPGLILSYNIILFYKGLKQSYVQ